MVVGSEAGSWVDSWAGLRRVSTLGAAGRRRGDDFAAKSVAGLPILAASAHTPMYSRSSEPNH